MMGIALTLTLSAWFFPLRLPPVGTRRTMLVDFWKQQRKFPMFALPAATINTVSAQLPVLIVASRFGTEFAGRSEEHTSELQSLMRTSYAVFCLKQKK